MIERKILLFILEKFFFDELYIEWFYINKEKKNNLNNEFINRIEVLEIVFFFLNIFEIKIRLFNVEIKNKNNCLVKKYDFFLNGMYCGRMKKLFFFLIINEILIENCIEMVELNKINDIFFFDFNFLENE